MENPSHPAEHSPKERTASPTVAAAATPLRRHFSKVHVQTAFACTGRCIHCPYGTCWHSARHGYMSDSVFAAICSQLSALAVDTVCPYLENEPFADPAIFERSAALWAACSATSWEFTTNAVLLDAVKREKLAQLLAGKSHVVRIIFPGTTRQQYQRVMGMPFGESLENTIAVLQLAQEAQLAIRIQCGGQGRAGGLFQEYQCTEAEFRAFWEAIFQKYGIHQPPLLCYTPWLDRIGSSLHRTGLHMPLPVRANLQGWSCPCASEYLHFLYTGEMVLCCMDYYRETLFGNAAVTDVQCILSSQKRQNLLAAVAGVEDSPPDFICKRCICPGG